MCFSEPHCNEIDTERYKDSGEFKEKYHKQEPFYTWQEQPASAR